MTEVWDTPKNWILESSWLNSSELATAICSMALWGPMIWKWDSIWG